MESKMSLAMIETAIKTFLQDIHTDPARGTRNLIDLGLHFFKGRFKKQILEIAQTMLKNPQSPYYALVKNTVLNTDPESIKTFGINLGYHSLTCGAETIRENEVKLKFNIPWYLIIYCTQNETILEKTALQKILREGIELGIKTFFLFLNPRIYPVDDILSEFPDCAFFLMSEPEHITPEFVQVIKKIKQVFCSVRYDTTDTACTASDLLRENKCLYGFHTYYNDSDKMRILDAS